VVILLNGAFGVGKTTVARRLVERLPAGAFYDPERIGFVLRRLPRFVPMRGRGAEPWSFWRAAECCEAHADSFFAEQVTTDDRTLDEIADVIAECVRERGDQPSPVAIGTSSASPHSAHDPS